MTRKIFAFALAGLLAAAPLASAACQQLPPPTVDWVQQSSVIPFELYRGNRVVAPGTVNGHSVEFVLDTGAGATVLDRAYARQIGIPKGQKIEAAGSGGAAEAELVTNVTLTIGGIRLTKVNAVVIDLSDVSSAIGRPMPVVLGRELFDNAVVTIDWDSSRLTLDKPAGFVAPKAARAVELGRRDGSFNTIQVAIEGQPPVTATLDLGNGGTLSLPKSYWSKRPELTGLPFAQSQGGGVGGLHPARLVTLKTVGIAGQTFRSVPASLNEEKTKEAVDDPNAGIGLLRPFKVSLDLGHDRLYLEPLAGAPAFQRDRSGLRTRLSGGAMEVIFVSPQGPAAAAGIKAGDRIVAINGEKVADDFYRTALGNWNQRNAGDEVALALADGRNLKVKLADYY